MYRFRTRKDVPTDPAKRFQRTLTAHLTACDGRAPFEPEEEAAILSVLRQKRKWPAFEGTALTIGSKGFRSAGFHEKRAFTALVRALTSPVAERFMRFQSAPTPATYDQTDKLLGARTKYHTAPVGVLAGQGPKEASAPGAVSPSTATSVETVTDDASENPMGFLGWLDDDLFHVRDDPSPLASQVVAPLKVHPSALLDEMPPAPTLHEAVRELAAFELIYPGRAAVALNTRATALEALYLAQNDVSVRFIGAVAASHAGKARALIAAGQEPAWVGRALQALRAGRDVEFTDQIVLVNGEQQWARFTMRHAGLLLVVGVQVV